MKALSVRFILLGVVAALCPVHLIAQSSPGSAKHQRIQDLRGSQLLGASLKGSDGQDMGEIKDLVIDPRTGRVNFAIIGVDAGNGTEALAPIPWQAVKLSTEKNYVASIDKSKLQQGPRLTEQQWDKLLQPDYVIQIYRFYGMTPSNTGGTGEGPGDTGSGSGQQSPQNQNQ